MAKIKAKVDKKLLGIAMLIMIIAIGMFIQTKLVIQYDFLKATVLDTLKDKATKITEEPVAIESEKPVPPVFVAQPVVQQIKPVQTFEFYRNPAE